MDANRLEGTATNLGGKVKDAVGGLTGDTRTQAEGKADQMTGRLQNTYGATKDAVRDEAATLGTQVDAFLKERPFAALLSAAAVGWVLSRMMRR